MPGTMSICPRDRSCLSQKDESGLSLTLSRPKMFICFLGFPCPTIPPLGTSGNWLVGGGGWVAVNRSHGLDSGKHIETQHRDATQR